MIFAIAYSAIKYNEEGHYQERGLGASFAVVTNKNEAHGLGYELSEKRFKKEDGWCNHFVIVSEPLSSKTMINELENRIP